MFSHRGNRIRHELRSVLIVDPENTTGRRIQTHSRAIDLVGHWRELVERICFVRTSGDHHLDHAIKRGKTKRLLTEDEDSRDRMAVTQTTEDRG